MFNLDFSDDLTKLNFIGVVSLFGGEIALSALRYSVLIENIPLSLYITMILSPGLQTVSLKMFRRMEGNVSRAIGGGSDDRKDIIGLSVNNKYKYVGLCSGTRMNVSSVLGEALITASEFLEKIDVPCSRKNPPKRGLKLKIIQLGELKNPDEQKLVSVKDKPSKRLCIIPPLTIAGMIIVILAEDYQVFALILLNVICNMLVTFTIRSNGIKYPTGNSAKGSPKGDVLVESVDGTELYLVTGHEDVIQYMFQKPLVMPPDPKYKLWIYLHMLAAYSSYIMVIINIIWLPFTTAGGQIMFGVLIFFGVVQNILLSTFDGDNLLLKVVEDFLVIGSVKEYVFQTRSTAVAFCMLKSKSSDPKPLRHLLPDTETFDTWFDNVANVVKNNVVNVDNVANVDNVENVASVDPKEKGQPNELLDILNGDLEDAVKEYKKEECEIKL